MGRREEVAQLRDCWELTCAGEPTVVSICGEAGIGKSRLSRLIAEEAVSGEATVSDCECSAYHTNTSLSPIVEMLTRQMGLEPAFTPDDPGSSVWNAF